MRAGGEGPAPRSHRALGLDAAGRHGWVGIVVDGAGLVDARLGSLAELVGWAEPVVAVGVDIPIGSIGGEPRRAADVAARRFVGGRAASVFAAPPAEVLAAASQHEANDLLVAGGAPRLSAQAWALVPRVREAAALAAADPRVVEIHPEVSFCELAGQPLAWAKKSWNGLLLRRHLLRQAGIELPDVLPELGGAVADDVVDAAAVAWSALRVARGEARPLPDPPPTDPATGRAVAIWR